MRKLLSILFSGALLATSLVTLSVTPASAAATITTCTDLKHQDMLALKAIQKSCKSMAAPALWQIQQPDSLAHSGAGYANIRVCSSKNPYFSYQTIKTSCYKNQITTDYWRVISAPEIPIIKEIMALGHNAAVVTFEPLKSETKIKLAVAYYLVTNIKTGQVSKSAPNNSSQIYIYDLNPLTSYTFQITAVSVDGSSAPSSITRVITTGAVPIVYVAPTTPPLAAPAFTLSSSSETRTVNTAATGFTILSTGGTIASFAISATPAGMSFSTSTGALTGTPTTVAGATTYTITATNATESASRTFSFTVTASFSTDATLSAASTIKGQTLIGLGTPSSTLASATGGTVTISAIKGADTSNIGSYVTAFTKTASSATVNRIVKYASGETYTGFATDTAYDSTAAITTGDFFIVQVTAEDGTTILYYKVTVTVSAAVVYTIGSTGPGGGIVYYVSASNFTSTGSTCNTACKYLEVAPAGWNNGAVVANDPLLVWSSNTSLATGQDTVTAGTESAFANEKFNWKIGQGFYNTSVMKVADATSTAQAAVLAYAGGSTAGQWFIPSMNELNELCKYARGQTTGVLTVPCTSGGTLKTGTADDLGGFVADYYWSSSEGVAIARSQTFNNGYQSYSSKSLTRYVRPVRAF